MHTPPICRSTNKIAIQAHSCSMCEKEIEENARYYEVVTSLISYRPKINLMHPECYHQFVAISKKIGIII